MSRVLAVLLVLVACVSLGQALKCFNQRAVEAAGPTFDDDFEPSHAVASECGAGFNSCMTQRALSGGSVYVLRSCDERKPAACVNYGSAKEPNYVCLCNGDLCNGRLAL